MIYFISAMSRKHVKIGHTNGDPLRRLSELQVANPERLVLLAMQDGRVEDERKLHEKFRDFRVGGEWFTLSAQIRNHITIENMRTTMDGWNEEIADAADAIEKRDGVDAAVAMLDALAVDGDNQPKHPWSEVRRMFNVPASRATLENPAGYVIKKLREIGGGA